jgi:hypothetical protein
LFAAIKQFAVVHGDHIKLLTLRLRYANYFQGILSRRVHCFALGLFASAAARGFLWTSRFLLVGAVVDGALGPAVV